MTIKRFDEGWRFNQKGMVEQPDGTWVGWGDHLHAMRDAEDNVSILTAACETWERRFTQREADHLAEVERLVGEVETDRDRLEIALNNVSAKEFANSGYNLPQMVRVIDESRNLKAAVAAKDRRIKELESALKVGHIALDEMCEWHGSTHEDDCPQDDTCNCIHKGFNDRVNKAFIEGEAALAKAEEPHG